MPSPTGGSRIGIARPEAPDLRSFRRSLGGTGRGGIIGAPIPLDNLDPKFGEYLAQIKEKIQANWGYPCAKNSVTERCNYQNAALVIEFGILKSGHLQFIELRRTSGSGLEIYDESAMNAIRLSSPFPAIPPDIVRVLAKGSTGMPIIATFTYTVEKSQP